MLSGLFAQLPVGAVFGVIVVFILQSNLIGLGNVTSDSKTVMANAVVAFIAGFSEPFALRTVERVASLGGGTEPTSLGGGTEPTNGNAIHRSTG